MPEKTSPWHVLPEWLEIDLIVPLPWPVFWIPDDDSVALLITRVRECPDENRDPNSFRCLLNFIPGKRVEKRIDVRRILRPHNKIWLGRFMVLNATSQSQRGVTVIG